ncbi:hypothetical protein CEXT_117541 [Caerostris extrusa]|uniref:Uncharacterized protein n=1 Tax=Caerostris extrusa TaxID=172846 RepID=A0AAV4QZR1_CAEEX|nr:hypothetical protein CEXT_117541 [Caerostris extrusa]
MQHQAYITENWGAPRALRTRDRKKESSSSKFAKKSNEIKPQQNKRLQIALTIRRIRRYIFLCPHFLTLAVRLTLDDTPLFSSHGRVVCKFGESSTKLRKCLMRITSLLYTCCRSHSTENDDSI